MFRLLALVACSFLASCASIVSKSQYHVPIDSVPPGATVAYDGANVGVTPCTVVMTTRCSVVTLKLANYHQQPVEVGRAMNGWIIGNVLFGGLIGLAVDGLGGSGGTISEKPCWVEMTPTSDPEPGMWFRPQLHEPNADEQGWIREGETRPTRVAKPTIVPTRAPALTEEAKRKRDAAAKLAKQTDSDGWIRTGN